VLVVPALAVLLASGAGALASPADARLLAALASSAAGGARAAAATRPLVGAPYVLSALGEGAGPDADPRFRLDAFDCLGFLETAIALGSSRSLEEAAHALDDVRYGGPPALDARNHEVQAQWLPRNLAKGWIVELTRPLAGVQAIPVPIEFTPARWRALRAARRAIDGLPAAREPVGRFELWAVPPEALVALGPSIPDGTAIVVVREDEPGRCTRVSHVGLVVAGPSGERSVRHATAWPRDGRGRVVEEPLAVFAERQRRARPGWPLAGFALFGLPDASARLAALLAARPM
jgi:hypothetical protein